MRKLVIELEINLNQTQMDAILDAIDEMGKKAIKATIKKAEE